MFFKICVKNVPKLNTLWKFGFEEMSMGILTEESKQKDTGD
jgi:hypothetical protein